jgi:protein O-GlcNAc transferase
MTDRSPPKRPGVPAQFELDRAISAYKERRFTEAEQLCRVILASKSDYFDALHLLAAVQLTLGRWNDALISYDRALALRPDQAGALCNRGVTLYNLGQFEEALASYDRAIVLRPDYAQALTNRGVTLHKLMRFEEALESCDRAITLRPDHAETFSNRGVTLHELKRFEEALESYDRALALRPNYAEAYYNRGNTLHELKLFEKALAGYDRAIALRRDYAQALTNRGVTLHALQRYEEALASYERALAVRPDYAEALYSRGTAFKKLRRLEEAWESFEQAVALKPDLKLGVDALADCTMKLCDWELADRLYCDLDRLVGEQETHGRPRGQVVSPFLYLGYCDDASMQLRCARNYLRDRIPTLPKPLWRDAIWTNDRIKIAYLSADFRQHPASQLAVDLFEQHDRSRFEVIGLSYGPDDGSEMRARLINAFDQFHNVRSVSDREVALLLNRMQVDIIVDLTGYTEYCRPEILSYRPAPITALFLGYPGTLGAAFIDYIIADRIVAPFDQQPFFTEQIVHLPHSYLVNSQRKIAAETPKRRAAGLPEESFVFCCFNNSYKINRKIFEVWMRLLGQVDGSVLWLMSTSGMACDHLRSEATKRGINPARLVFAEPQPFGQHLARHRLADIFLDTLPYNAHTTASDALWAGLPVLTCYGTSFQGRVAASVLNAVGLPELVTADLEEYEVLALRLAIQPQLLADLKARLERNRQACPLFDVDRFRRHIESAYTTMWEFWQHGERPRSFSVEPKG